LAFNFRACPHVPDIDLSSFYYSHWEAFSPQENNNTQKTALSRPESHFSIKASLLT